MCPQTCEATQHAGRDPYGCHGPLSKPLDTIIPGRFDRCPGGVPRCPWRLLRDPDPWRDQIFHLVRDYRAGVIRGWPDAYTAATVEAVRYVLNESDACTAEMYDRM